MENEEILVAICKIKLFLLVFFTAFKLAIFDFDHCNFGACHLSHKLNPLNIKLSAIEIAGSYFLVISTN